MFHRYSLPPSSGNDVMGDHCLDSLMMEEGNDCLMSHYCSILTQLIAQENFIACIHRESQQSSMNINFNYDFCIEILDISTMNKG
jgi:hypothetical protein